MPLTHALDSYGGATLYKNTKRGLSGGIGKLSPLLFESAMNEDVIELRDNFNQLVSCFCSKKSY